MARIQKRQNKTGAPIYVVKWRTADGHDRSKGGFRTRKAANAYATEQAAARLRGTTFDPASGAVTFRVAAQAWLASRHDLKPTTIAGYRYALAPAGECRRPRQRLGIDATFGGYPLNAITRTQINEWVARLVAAGKKPSTVRLAVLIVRQVLAQAVADGRLPSNPAEHVKLPRVSAPGSPGAADPVSKGTAFLTVAQVAALVAATPWPYNVLVHAAAWSGLRAGELCGLLVGDVAGGHLQVARTLAALNGELVYQSPKTKGSSRRVPLTPDTMALLQSYLAEHPHGPNASHPNPVRPLWPAIRLGPGGSRLGTHDAALSVAEVEARLVLDWAQPLRHTTFYQRVFTPSAARANRLGAGLPNGLVFHSLRHTYVSRCVAAGIPPLEISRFAGHSTVTTTLSIYAHLFESDHSAAMAALGAMGQPAAAADNVVPLRR